MDGSGDVFHARDHEPWLRIESESLRRFAGSLVEIVYRACLWDEPARPVFRFLRGGDVLGEAIAPAPLDAVGIWTGRVPAGADTVHVSPTNRPGPFGFRVESIRHRAWLALLEEGRRRAPRPARSALLTRLIGWGPESDNNLAWAIGAHPLETYPIWAARRRRSLEPDGIDASRLRPDDTMAFRIFVRTDASDDPHAVERTLASLRAQTFPRWQATVSPLATEAADTLRREEAWFAVLRAGSILRPEALAIVAERHAREPDIPLFYGDELSGGFPSLKPGWSPRFAASLPFLGDAVFASADILSVVDFEAVLNGHSWRLPRAVTPRPLRRIVVETPHAAATASAPSGDTPSASPACAAIIVLTRDQPALLKRLVDSIRARTASGSYHLIVVDNGVPGGAASALLAELAAAQDAMVLTRPGPFNFSALSNEGAAATEEPLLVFLNDDMEVLSDHWLDRLAARALEPDIGAVGAKLTYPDGRLQHVGVLAGMGGSAGHFGAPAPGDDPGWAGRNLALHEVSAVTGACLAVSREKFDAVGGFDAEHLPVELSDIDLCLKLNARGWQTLVDPAVHLMHEESFSRGGATFRRLDKYGGQRAVFLDRWRHVLRDDPVFHPALSLYSWRAALG